MDPRRLLGLAPGAGAEAVQAAHDRLAAHVDPAAGGTRELRRLVDAARDVLLRGADPAALGVDPHGLLGVRPGAGSGDIRAAYRRLAARVHPDRGGTDELFVVVDTAFELLTRPATHATARRRTAGQWPRPRPTPPPAPPPPGPWVPPPPDTRFVPAPWRVAWALAFNGGVIVVGVALWAVASLLLWREGGLAGLALALPILVLAAAAARPVALELLRAAVLARRSHTRIDPRRDPARFLAERCLGGMVVREDEDSLYRAYVAWCGARGERPVSAWVFVEHLRSLGLLYVKASTWESGVWVGVELRERRPTGARPDPGDDNGRRAAR